MDAAGKLAIDMKYINPLAVSIKLDNKSKFQMYAENKPLPVPTAVINRFGVRGYAFGYLVGHYCKACAIPLINPFDSVIYGKNKFISLNIARELGIEIPVTFFPAYASDLSAHIAGKVRPPFIVKIQTGTQGIGVMLARDAGTMQAISDYLWDKNEIFIIQHFIDKSERLYDVRLLFFDNEFLGAFSKVSRKDEFRANFHRGGNVSGYDPERALIDQSLQLMKKTGLRFAGIDYIIKKDKSPVFLEINESPGFEAFENIHGRFVAERVLEMLANSLG